VSTRRTAEPLTKFSWEMGVVAKPVGIGDVAERLACAQQRPSAHYRRGRIALLSCYRPSANGMLVAIS
jgi:hypothetical protein